MLGICEAVVSVAVRSKLIVIGSFISKPVHCRGSSHFLHRRMAAVGIPCPSSPSFVFDKEYPYFMLSPAEAKTSFQLLKTSRTLSTPKGEKATEAQGKTLPREEMELGFELSTYWGECSLFFPITVFLKIHKHFHLIVFMASRNPLIC